MWSFPHSPEDGNFETTTKSNAFFAQNAAALQHFRESRQLRQRRRDFIGRSSILASDREDAVHASEIDGGQRNLAIPFRSLQRSSSFNPLPMAQEFRLTSTFAVMRKVRDLFGFSDITASRKEYSHPLQCPSVMVNRDMEKSR